MRTLFTIIACFVLFTLRAQNLLTQQPQQVPASLQLSRPGFFVQPFSSVNVGYLFLGGGLSYVSAPIGIAVYRPLNQNFTAFTAATLAPTAFHFSSLYSTPFHNPVYPGGGFTGFGVNAAVSGGLIYTNDAHTFSISGSIMVERGSYPIYIPPSRTTATKQY